MKRSVEHFLKLFLCIILIRDCSKHIDETYLQQSKALKVHSVNEFVHGFRLKIVIEGRLF